MGGGSSSGGSTPQPYDLLGGQYASFSGGTPSGINWSGVGQDIGAGITGAGHAIGQMQTPIPQFQAPEISSQNQQYGAPYALQQGQAAFPGSQNLDALARIMSLFGG